MTVEKGRVYAGYSLLLDPNYEAMVSALNPNMKKNRIAWHSIGPKSCRFHPTISCA